MTSSPSKHGKSNSKSHHTHYASTSLSTDGRSQPSQEYLIRHRKKSHKKRNRIIKIVLIVIGVILAVVAGGAAAYFAVNGHMDNMIKDINKNADIQTDGSSDKGQTVSYNGHTYKLNANMVSILLIGHDDDEDTIANSKSEADMIAVAALDTSTGKLTIIGIPRDSYVLVDEYGVDANGVRSDYVGQSMMQLSLAYTYGNNEQGAENVKAAVQRTLLNIPITYYMDIEQSGVADMANAVGGVMVNALETIPSINAVKGEDILLMGNHAYSYISYRTGEHGSSLQRQARQAQFIDAFIKKMFRNSGGGIGYLTDLYTKALEHTQTNIDMSAAVYLGSCCINNGVSMGQIKSLQGELGIEGGYDAVYLDKDGITETVLGTYYTRLD